MTPARTGRCERRTRLVATAVAALALGGCSAADAVLSMLRSTDRFVIDAAEPRIRYEPGGEALARQVGRHLDEAVKTVEEGQYRPLVKPVVVYVCATTEGCRAYCRHNVRGCTVNGKIFLSPKPTLTAERVPGILKHELSHLHMEQHVGMLRWHAGAPPWFQEGLAVFVSGGGGAENITASQARAAIAAGRTFSPEPAGSLLFRKRHGLEQHLFYRQSALFVAFLHAKDPKAFEALLAGLVARTGFATAVRDSYQTDLENLWSQFVTQTKTNTRAVATLENAPAHSGVIP